MNNQTLRAWASSKDQDARDFYLMANLSNPKSQSKIFPKALRDAIALNRHVSAYESKM